MRRSPTVTSPAKGYSPPNAKSFITRVTSPFSSKQQSQVRQEIRLDEPFRQYFSGDYVKGAVHLKTAKPLRITHIVIRLHGFVKVVNTPRQPGEDIPYDENLLTSMRSRRGIEYFGNGFARLFEDECILCGDGRLSGEYEFRFELKLPSKNVPSSIDFEHGTVRYLLSSTLTRPTAILPTIHTHYKLNVTGTLDIACLQIPKTHTVSLEAIGKKKSSRIRPAKKSIPFENSRHSTSSSLDENPVTRVASSGLQRSDAPPQSPVPSFMSSTSAESSTLSANNMVLRTSAAAENHEHPDNSSVSICPQKIITAQTMLLQGGCLPGDVLHLRVSINHTKAVKTMQGLIVTIYRQGRIDTHPDIPLGPLDHAGRQRYEDYYPRSRTGLGGLSLSSAGSSRLFRQDLAQTITPLIVDPQSLIATIKTSVQMPDHVFPTINCVPGGMISFKYFVEVVIDLRGKHVSQDRFMPNLSIINGPQHAYGDAKVSRIEGADGTSYSATPGFHYLITDQIRRNKGVVFTTTEVVVGTRDSTRSRGKQREEVQSLNYDQSSSVRLDGTQSPQEFDDQPEYDEERWTEQHADYSSSANDIYPPSNALLPLPDMNESMDEKSQIRRAEQRLLPSAPDVESPIDPITPSAPFAFDEEDFMNRYGYHAPAPAYEGRAASSHTSPRTIISHEHPQNESAAESRAHPDEGVVHQNEGSSTSYDLQIAPDDSSEPRDDTTGT